MADVHLCIPHAENLVRGGGYCTVCSLQRQTSDIGGSVNKDTQDALFAIDDVRQSMEHTFKKLKYDGDREALESEFDLFLEAWIDDLEKAAKLLAGNL